MLNQSDTRRRASCDVNGPSTLDSHAQRSRAQSLVMSCARASHRSWQTEDLNRTRAVRRHALTGYNLCALLLHSDLLVFRVPVVALLMRYPSRAIKETLYK